MLAEEYGYQVSAGRAADIPGVMDILRSSQRRSRQRRVSGVVVLACFGALWVFPATHLILFAVAFLFSPIVITVLWVMISDAGWPNTTELMRLAQQHPFQAWPCQVEEDRKGWNSKRIQLLAPDGSVAREFRTKMPDRAWQGMTDGRGVLWIAGDLRFSCLVAVPGAGNVWGSRPMPHAPQPSRSSRLNAVEDELIRAATQEAFRGWLF
ncbi:hypothetical protein OIE63_36510 [Streptomyces sp. NBC_01795]|uniref:hypothetical protein n=1 Tax=unclassified Streptomyces TaxID=2593676 RepID=UPI002DD8CA50|nr:MULTISPECIES: hypothetical protein [unclassified Streptomyces]WSA96457.1 hypothetical protein OIE63_36510 [Streptomyces sp. NBC_01795]WSB80869.1 hypothetical protein OHB04_37630 [Streptomyces sp. NBC_01775]WSS10919.1 hypothetical protein OG533_02625 [Streptomyces sp. NBC_01186]